MNINPYGIIKYIKFIPVISPINTAQMPYGIKLRNNEIEFLRTFKNFRSSVSYCFVSSAFMIRIFPMWPNRRLDGTG